MQNWNTSRIFSHKEIKSATRNFKEVIGRGSFGAVYRGKLPDGKQVAVKVRFDRTQLGADSFINEVKCPHSSPKITVHIECHAFQIHGQEYIHLY